MAGSLCRRSPAWTRSPGGGGPPARSRSPRAAAGRVPVPAFTCLDSLTRWRRDARPVPVPADRVWEAATQAAQEASAVVIDVAGPVPLALDGARLAALAEGRKVPLPYEDPDVQAAAEAAVASEPLITGGLLARPGDDSDLARSEEHTS